VDETSFIALKAIPQLHFLSMQVFEDRHFDPLLVFENNFDGDTKSYWAALEAQLGNELSQIFACIQVAGRWETTFQGNPPASLVPFMAANAVEPSAYHVGAVGLTADWIRRELELFEEIQIELGVRYAAPTALQLQTDLQAWAWSLPQFQWLKKQEVRRSLREWPEEQFWP